MGKYPAAQAALFLLAAGLAGCVLAPPAGGMSYAEVAAFDPSCPQGVCDAEYVVFSHGLVFSRLQGTAGSAPTYALGTIDAASAQAVIDGATRIEARQSDCADCPGIHVLYQAQGKTVSHATKDLAAAQPARFLSAAKAAAANATPGGLFVLHLVRWKEGEYLADYHAFFDGTVLYEEFDGDLNMKAARLWKLDARKTAQLRGTFTPDVFSSGQETEDCRPAGIAYGYLEARSDERYVNVRTCGAGKGAAAHAYAKSLELLSG